MTYILSEEDRRKQRDELECVREQLDLMGEAGLVVRLDAALSLLAGLPEVQDEDTKRLDWLDTRRDLFFDCYMLDGKLTHILRQHWGAALGHGPTPRAAIDAAMKEHPQPRANP